MKNTKIKKGLLFCLPFFVSAVLLTLIQPPISWSPLAWLSLVPFIFACSPNAKPKPLALGAYIVSVCYWLGNLYWLYPITRVGWLVLCLYMALLWPVLALCLRYCRIKRIPLFVAVPVLVVGAERLQGVFLGGFFWRLLAHSQYNEISLIQIADIFGAAGVSFLIAMVNGLAAELIIAVREKNIFKISNFVKTAFVCGAVVGAILYGRWRINQSDKYIEPGPLVASLQSNVPQSVKRGGGASDVIFNDLLQSSKASAQVGAELIIWPETMVQATLNSEVLRFLDFSARDRIFDDVLREHSKESGFVLVGANAETVDLQGTDYVISERYNSAFLYRPDGQQDEKRYDKIHLVLFGEVLPFRKSFPLLYKLLMIFNPMGYDHSLDAGSEYTVFEMSGGEEKKLYNFSVLICYEGTIPAIARRFAINSQGRKQIDWLVNISNDGWFVKFEDGKVFPSTELPQHASIYVFRAVENRLAVVRSVNTGISSLIDSVGRIKNGFLAGNLPKKAMERTGCAGWFVDRVAIDTRVTFFSRNGQWLDFCCAFALGALIIMALLEGFIGNKKYIFSFRRQHEKQI